MNPAFHCCHFSYWILKSLPFIILSVGMCEFHKEHTSTKENNKNKELGLLFGSFAWCFCQSFFFSFLSWKKKKKTVFRSFLSNNLPSTHISVSYLCRSISAFLWTWCDDCVHGWFWPFHRIYSVHIARKMCIFKTHGARDNSVLVERLFRISYSKREKKNQNERKKDVARCVLNRGASVRVFTFEWTFDRPQKVVKAR